MKSDLCRQTAEWIPWFLNGTLEADLHRQVEEHLGTCVKCQAELDEAQAAWMLADTHLPVDALLDLADSKREPLEVEARHLAECPACSEELSLLRIGREFLARTVQAAGEASPFGSRSVAGLGGAASQVPDVSVERRDVGSDEVSDAGRGDPGFGPVLRMAAGILLLLALTGWWFAWQRATRFGEEIASLRAPSLNVLTVDLLPESLTTRAPGSLDNLSEIPADKPATLILNSNQREAAESYRVELRNETGDPVWKSDGVRRNPTGDYTLSLTGGFLPPGQYEVRIVGTSASGEESVEVYRLSVVP